jgi:hypothetical protein
MRAACPAEAKKMPYCLCIGVVSFMFYAIEVC